MVFQMSALILETVSDESFPTVNTLAEDKYVSVNKMTIPEAALHYKKLGILTHQLYGPQAEGCNSPGKQPISSGWQKKASPLIDRAIAAFDPKNNLGFLTGRHSNLLILDIDWYVPALWDEILRFVSPLVKVQHAPNRFHVLFTYNDAIKAGQYKFLGFDILSDDTVKDTKGIPSVSGDNCVAPPSIHKDGSKYELIGSIEERPSMPFEMMMHIRELIETHNNVTKNVLPKCRTWFRNLWKNLFELKDSDLFHHGEIFYGDGEARNRCLNFFAELKVNGATDQDMIYVCTLLFGDRFNDIISRKELSHVKDKPATTETVKADPYFSRFYTEFKTEQKQEGRQEALFDLDSVSGRNRMYHKLAKIYTVEHTVKYVAGSLKIYKDGIYKSDDETLSFVKNEIMELGLKLDTPLAKNNIENIVSVLETSHPIKLSSCEPDSDSVIVANNGIYNFRTNELMPFDADKVYFSKIPVDYIPDAPEPTLFKKYIEMVFKDNEAQKELLQEITGYCLTRNHRYQRIFYLLGDGGNGKGTYLEILRALLGAENTTAFSLDQLTDSSDVTYNLAELHGRYANICGDVGDKSIKNTEHIKKLSSGTDAISGRHPYGKPFSFVSYAKLIFAMNKMPQKQAFTTGDKRRDCQIEFINKISETNLEVKGLATKIIESGELPGILLWALEGLRRLEAKQDFTDKRTVAQRGLEYDKRSNPIKYFVDDRIEDALGCFTSTYALLDDYSTYRKLARMPELGESEFKKELELKCEDAGIKIKPHREKDSQGVYRRGYRGIKIISSVEKSCDGVNVSLSNYPLLMN